MSHYSDLNKENKELKIYRPFGPSIGHCKLPQELINDLEGKTSEQRVSTVELQNAGIISWFKDSSVKNLQRIKEENYGKNIEEERLNRIEEVLLTQQTEMEVSEHFGVDMDLLLQNMNQVDLDPIQEEAYAQNDQDREDEGNDDGDHDGDYREN